MRLATFVTALAFVVSLAALLPEGETVTITFDANGGTGTMEPITVDKDTTAELTREEFEAPENTSWFLGWNTAADGSGTALKDNQAIDLDTLKEINPNWTTNNSEVTLYAQWTQLGNVVIPLLEGKE